ncbi:ABC transporter permease subunit [Cysteiniphilum sp. QT6929]|uniref:ABC transporter permease n=1 Tax=Cysteiniphilum sp. QT6929 TaxID=2975055 RepID=UPI0024B338C6|nr:ABC transporter permease subunit [Cysteiniphilum sp. QT6929]WHN66022.1 ABC transporter permease subunit [Cysteiniphilum sp. QT6929]
MKKSFYNIPATRLLPSKWDLFSLFFVLSMVFVVAWVCSSLGGSVDYRNLTSVTQYEHISMDLWNLPRYAADTTVRMFIALFCSFIFSFVIGAWAAKSKRAESVIIPIIDIFQSIPILGFLAITITGFLAIFPYSLWGAQLAVIFGLFTAQAWNMMLSFYQSLKTIPKELREAADMYQLSGWQRFWKLEVPFSMPGLIWNTMMSMSASWFMIVASESIVVNFSATTSAAINLPGIGTFIDQANNERNFTAVIAAIVVMLIVIVLYDQLIFRPIVKWSEKFVVSDMQQETGSNSWFLTLLQRSTILQSFSHFMAVQANRLVNISYLKKDLSKNYNQIEHQKNERENSRLQAAIWQLCVALSVALFLYLSWQFIYGNKEDPITFAETVKVFGYGALTAVRVFVLIILASIIWVPIGIWIGLRPKVAEKVQPYAQIFAAFPVNVLYGLFGTVVIAFNLNFNIWCILLMALGTQWYILFNVIAGASAIPYELKMAAKNMQLKGMVKWFKFLFPAVMPFYVTGAITAAGGAWNASIVCEYINWGKDSVIMASGIGAYISKQYNAPGDHTANIALGVVVMCILVVLTNKLFWRRLYNYAEKRFSMNM